MTRSTAQKYSSIFEAVAEPEALIMLDYLRSEGDKKTLEKLADIASSSESKARSILERLESVYIVNEDRSGSETTYYYESTSMANWFKTVLDRIS